jgi:hypothetical protein
MPLSLYEVVQGIVQGVRFLPVVVVLLAGLADLRSLFVSGSALWVHSVNHRPSPSAAPPIASDKADDNTSRNAEYQAECDKQVTDMAHDGTASPECASASDAPR